MTGFNHYSNCTCGWCVNYGRSRAALADYEHDFRERDARLLLKRSGANSVAGCYVNPNARCPRCGVPVFFYANAAGSRVYFDDLGPPWPKHPCTDNSRRSILLGATHTYRPTRRNKGEVKELLNAAAIAGLSRFRSSGKRSAGEWTLVVILAVDRRGQENRVEGEFLDSDKNEAYRFTCHSEAPLFEVGEFVSVNDNQISFVDRETLLPMVFAVGSWVTPAPMLSTPKQSAPIPRPATKPVSKSKPAQLIRKKQKQKNVDGSKYDLTVAEMVHFDNKKVTLAELFGKLEPVVKTYAREGTRKPRDVADRLNAHGFRTASGSKWTPRLVYFLLRLMFNDTSTSVATNKRQHGEPLPVAPRPKIAPPPALGDMSLDEIARRLSHLGKIIRSEET